MGFHSNVALLSRRYEPSLLIMATFVLHLSCLAGFFLAPTLGWIMLVLLLGNHLILTLAGMWPRSLWLGPNVVRWTGGEKNTVYLTFDDGPDPRVTPDILDLLDRYDQKATFFLIGDRASRHPALLRDILARGHGIGNHSHRHGYGFALHSITGYVEELKQAQDVFQRLGGVTPRYFRAPFGIRSPFLEPALCRTGLDLVSWTRRGFDTRCKDADLVLARLCKELHTGDILLLHDIETGQGATGNVSLSLDVLPRLLDTLDQMGLKSRAIPGWSRSDH